MAFPTTGVSAAKTAEPFKPYKYPRLNSEAQEIRLLTLLPGKFESDVSISLKTSLFTEDNVPEYEALSYAWGSLEDPVNIFIKTTPDDSDSDSVEASESLDSDFCILAVTKNLAEALPNLRYEDRPRVLWIDAICVNQQNLEERSSQVKRMADIFSKASRVVIWLGGESDDSDVAMDCMQEVAANVSVDWGRVAMSTSALASEEHWGRGKSLPFGKNQMLAISNLINRSWFERLWIWQEVWLASSAVAMCGSRVLPWESIRTTAYCLFVKYLPTREAWELLNRTDRIELLYCLCRTGILSKWPLEGLIDVTKNCLCSDARDRIFALLSIVHPRDKFDFEPDYTKTTAEVYQDVVLRYIDQKHSLQTMTSVEIDRGIEGMPSWVPDWSTKRLTNSFRYGYASGPSSATAVVHENQILHVSGISVGRVEEVEAIHIQRNLDADRNELVDAMSRTYDKGSIIAQGSQHLRALCRAMCSGIFSDAFYPPKQNHLSLQRSEEILYGIIQHQSAPANEPEFRDEVKLIRGASYYCENRSFFLTEGRVGLGPKSTQTGDVLAILLGCCSAMVLRPIGNNQFRLVGEAYCEGFMCGEALLGPFPSSFAHIWRYDEGTDRNWPSFIDRKSDFLQAEDPRLKDVPLPLGWSRRAHSQEDLFTKFVNEETLEEMDGDRHDPRMTAEALRERGVELQTFSLI